MNFKIKKNNSSIIIIIIIIIIIAISLWLTVGINELTKLPTNYTMVLEHKGTDQLLSSINGTLSEPFEFEESTIVKTKKVNRNVLELEFHDVTTNDETDEIYFDVTESLFVDRVTRQHVQNYDGQYIFPPNVQKQTYHFYHPLVLAPADFVFKKEDTVYDLPVYVFSCDVKNYDLSYAYPHLAPAKIMYDGTCESWVEPISGKMVNFKLDWDVYMIENGIKKTVGKGGRVLDDDTVYSLVQDATSTKQLYTMYHTTFTIIIIIIGFIIILATIMKSKLKEKEELLVWHNQQQKNLEEQIKINKQKEDFSNMIQHELKTPIVPIITYCKMFKKSMFGKMDKEQIDAITVIEKNARKLDNTLSNIIDMRKIATNQMKFEINDLSLDEFFSEIESDYKSILENKGCQFTTICEKNLSIKTDRIRLRQVYDKVLDNAIQFIPKNDGRIEIGCKKENEKIIFYIKDNGIGIPKSKQVDLFKDFSQISSGHTRTHGGIGLSLAICKGIVEGLGGKIWIESEEGKGTSVYFTIPKNNP